MKSGLGCWTTFRLLYPRRAKYRRTSLEQCDPVFILHQTGPVPDRWCSMSKYKHIFFSTVTSSLGTVREYLSVLLIYKWTNFILTFVACLCICCGMKTFFFSTRWETGGFVLLKWHSPIDRLPIRPMNWCGRGFLVILKSISLNGLLESHVFWKKEGKRNHTVAKPTK